MGSTRFRVSTMVVLGVTLLGVGLAQAAETSRAEYKAAVEPICQKNTEANKQLLRGVKAEVRRHKWKPAARQLARAAAAAPRELLVFHACLRGKGSQGERGVRWGARD